MTSPHNDGEHFLRLSHSFRPIGAINPTVTNVRLHLGAIDPEKQWVRAYQCARHVKYANTV